jgi:hypothetical protein
MSSHRPSPAPIIAVKSRASAQSLEEKALASHERHRQLEALHNQFQSGDLPAFETWLDTEFGKERAEAFAVEKKIDELERILLDSEDAWRSGKARSLKEAVAAQWEAAQARADTEDADKAAYKATAGLPPEEFEELFRSFLRQMRGIDLDAMDEASCQKARADFAEGMNRAAAGDRLGYEKLMMRTAADESANNVSQVKAIYRRLAKRLHPDQNGGWDEHEKRLWEEASFAYEALNLEDLQRIELLLCLHRREEIPATRRGELQKWMKRITEAIAALERELRELRQHPAWGFAKRRRTKAFREKIRMEIAQGLSQGRLQIAMLEREIELLLQRRVRKKAAPSRRKKPRTPQ